jgi:hypothetical protein
MEAGQITNTANTTENKTAAAQDKDPATQMPVLQNRNTHRPRSVRKRGPPKQYLSVRQEGLLEKQFVPVV